MSSPHHVADTDPYPWPYDGALRVDHLALVVLGAQRQLIDASTDAAAVMARLDAIATGIRSGGGLVVWVRHGSAGGTGRPLPFLPLTDSDGWQLVGAPGPGDLVIDSAGWDGCFGSHLDHTLRLHGSPELVLGGFASEVTVDSTVRTLNDRGHECLVLTDGCAPLDAAMGARAHHSLTMSGGIFGALGTTHALLEVLHHPLTDLDEEIPA